MNGRVPLATGRRAVRTRATALAVSVAVWAPLRPSLAQCPDGTPPPCAGRPARAAAPAANSVAVVPFENVTGDTAFAYLADGLASSIATTLGQVPRLEVRSPGFVRRVAQARRRDERALGRLLDVRYIVEGEYQRGGDRIRVAVRLVALPSGTERWAEAFTRPSTDLLDVQEDIAREVATRIAGTLLPTERRALAARPTRSAPAFDLVLRGNFYLAQRTAAAVGQAIQEYEAAERLDSAYADPGARVAYAYGLVVYYGWDLGPPLDTVLGRGIAAADHALSLDSTSSDAWMARGFLLTFRNPHSFEGAIASLERAVRLDPRNTEAWHQLGTTLLFLTRYAAADLALRRASALEPDRVVTLSNLANAAEAAGRLADARRWADSAVAVNPTWILAQGSRLRLAIGRGDTAEIMLAAAAIERSASTADVPLAMLAKAEFAMWQRDTAAARAAAARAVEYFDQGPHTLWIGMPAAAALLEAGEPEQALDLLERLQPHGAMMHGWLQSPVMVGLQGSPRYARLLAESGAPGPR